MGFEESSYVVNSDKRYMFVPHDKQRYIGYKRNTTRQNHSKMEIVNGTRILHIGNKTYVLGTVRSGYHPVDVEDSKPDGYSIMQAPFFVHKAYLEMFFDPVMVPLSAVRHVEALNNCEDILLSIMVTKFFQDLKEPQCGVLAIKSSLSIKDIESESSELICIC